MKRLLLGLVIASQLTLAAADKRPPRPQSWFRTAGGCTAAVLVVALCLGNRSCQDNIELWRFTHEVNQRNGELIFDYMDLALVEKASPTEQDQIFRTGARWIQAELLRTREGRAYLYRAIMKYGNVNPVVFSEAKARKIPLNLEETFCQFLGFETEKGAIRYYLDSDSQDYANREALNGFLGAVLKMRFQEWAQKKQSGNLSPDQLRWKVLDLFEDWTKYRPTFF